MHQTPDPKSGRRPYHAPRLVHHGHMTRVTKKSGVIPDQKQTQKPGLGGG